MISLTDAVEKANALVDNNTGVKCDPDMVRRIDRNGKRYWWVIYDEYQFRSVTIDENAVVDGGEYIISVDCENGDAKVVG